MLFTSTILKIFIIIHHSFGMIIINGIGEGGGVEVGVALILNILIVYAWNQCLTIYFLLVLY